MKWMLIVVVFGIAPVKTGLLFDDLAACWARRETVAQEYAAVANENLRWARENLSEEARPRTEALITSSLTSNAITCIPHAATE